MPAVQLGDVALGLSRRPLASADPLTFLGAAAAEVARALDVAGAVLVVPATGWVRGSDDLATLVGEMQQRDGQGPLTTAMRTLRPMLTPDLTRIGPPSLAALAAEVGFGGSAAVALLADGRVVAGLQVIGRAGRPTEPRYVEALGEIADVLGARIADLVELARLRRPAPPSAALRDPALRDPVVADDTTALPAQRAVEPAGEPGFVPLSEAPPELATQEFRAVASSVVPSPRREPPPRTPGSRHRLEG